MAVSFNVPKSPAKSILTIDTFQGVDFTNSPANVADSKSPNAVNMIRDVPGKVRKCMGYETVATYKDGEDNPLPINGFHLLRNDESGFIHAGTSIFWDKIWLYDSANNARSKSWQFEKKLYLLDGKELLVMYSELDEHAGESTTGVHSKEVSGKTFSDTLTLKEEDFVNFYLPFECTSVDITYDETTVSVDLDDATEYKFENTYGDYEFEFTFYATLTTIEDTTYREYNTGVLGLDTDVTISANPSTGNITDITVEYDLGSIKKSFIIEIEDEQSHTWTNEIGEFDFTFYSGTTGERKNKISDWMVIMDEGSGTIYCADVFDSKPYTVPTGKDIIISADHAFTGDIEYTVVRGESETTYYEGWLSREEHSINWPANADAVIVKNLTIRFSGSYDEAIGETYYMSSFEDFNFDVSYANTIDLKGTFTYVVNQELTNGFVDDREGGFIDRNGYRHYVKRVADNAYIPLVTISKNPEGGGEPHEDLNLLTPAFTEQFLAQEDPQTHVWPKDYHLSFTGLDEVEPKVWLLDSDGEWDLQTYGTDYTCDYAGGIISFVTAPGASPVTGQDNVKVEAYRTVSGYSDQINKCTFGILYGVNGASDRLFVSGNPEFINRDWYSGLNDPTYFPDTSYSILGTSGSAIVGYSIISNYLAAHKDWMERDQNIILRQGDLVDSEPSFRIINTLQGAGAVASHSFAYLATEPLFLTRQGIYAVTAQDITGEKYSQNRSYFLDGKLLNEKNLEKAFGFVYKDMYWLCLNNVAYILDGLQPMQTDRSMPYATRQYAGFYRTNLPANVMWEQDERLYFGTPDGRVCRFYNDKYSLDSYNDDGEPIEAIWETPDIDGKLFYKNKTLRYIALRLDSALATSVSIWVMNRGLWQFIKKDDTSGRYFSFMHLIFSKLSFSGDRTQHTISTKVRVKKVDKFRLRLTNDDLNEPFGLFNIAFEYVENGNYKG